MLAAGHGIPDWFAESRLWLAADAAEASTPLLTCSMVGHERVVVF